MQMKCKKGIWIGTILNHFLSITARSEYSCIEMNISAQIIQKTLFLDLHYFDAEVFFHTTRTLASLVCKAITQIRFRLIRLFDPKNPQWRFPPKCFEVELCKLSEFWISFLLIGFMRKKLWDEKKTFNRIKIGNEKKLTEKKVFTKEIEKKYFEFYTVNHVEKQKINPKFFLFQYWNVKAGFLLPLLLKCCKHSIVQIFPIFNIQANDNKSAENS